MFQNLISTTNNLQVIMLDVAKKITKYDIINDAWRASNWSFMNHLQFEQMCWLGQLSCFRRYLMLKIDLFLYDNNHSIGF